MASTFVGGGGVFNDGTLRVVDSVVTDNHAEYFGGGLNNAGTLVVERCEWGFFYHELLADFVIQAPPGGMVIWRESAGNDATGLVAPADGLHG